MEATIKKEFLYGKAKSTKLYSNLWNLLDCTHDPKKNLLSMKSKIRGKCLMIKNFHQGKLL